MAAVRVTEKDPTGGCRRGQVMRGRPSCGASDKGAKSAVTRVHSPSQTGVNALMDALWVRR